MSIDSIARNIISRHDPENDIIPGMDRRVSWAERELAEAVLSLLERVENLETMQREMDSKFSEIGQILRAQREAALKAGA